MNFCQFILETSYNNYDVSVVQSNPQGYAWLFDEFLHVEMWCVFFSSSSVEILFNSTKDVFDLQKEINLGPLRPFKSDCVCNPKLCDCITHH